jgi:hypothetical protein
VGKLLFRIDRVTSPRVQDGPGGSFATIVLTVPASSADIATSQMLGHRGRKLAVVAGDELVGYLSSVPAPTRVTIGRVPAGLARKLAADL